MEYKKDLRKVTDSYRGYQTMDSAEHPVVKQAVKATELSSEVGIANTGMENFYQHHGLFSLPM